MAEDKVKIIEYVDRNGVVTKRTANGFELPLPMGDKPSYCIVGDMEWGVKKFYITQKQIDEYYKIFNSIQHE